MKQNYKKLTKTQVVVKLREFGTLEVELYPSNCAPTNQNWVQGMQVDLKLNNNGAAVYNNGTEDIPFESLIANFQHYACSSELGNRVHYYITT